MELIEQDNLPGIEDFIGRIFKSAKLACSCAEGFNVVIKQLALAVIFLVACLSGEGASVVFKVKLASPLWQALAASDLGIKALEEVERIFHLNLRTARNTFSHSHAAFDVSSGRSAAAVTVAVDAHFFLCKVLIAVSLPAVDNVRRVEHCGISCLEAFFVAVTHTGCKVGKDFAAVDTFPEESIKREAVIFAPGNLGCHEIIDIGKLHNLRQCGCVAENVGQPHDFIINAEFVLEETLADKELPDKGFARNNVCIGFNPHTAFGFPAAFLDFFLDFFVKLGVILLHIVIKLSLRGHEFIFGEFFHKVDNRCERTPSLIPCLAQSPEPGNVDMSMTDGGNEDIALFAVYIFMKICAGSPDGCFVNIFVGR